MPKKSPDTLFCKEAMTTVQADQSTVAVITRLNLLAHETGGYTVCPELSRELAHRNMTAPPAPAGTSVETRARVLMLLWQGVLPEKLIEMMKLNCKLMGGCTEVLTAACEEYAVTVENLLYEKPEDKDEQP